MAETIMPAYSEQGDLNGKFNSLVQLIGPVPSGKTVQGEIDTNTQAITNYTKMDGTLIYITSGDIRSINNSGRYYVSGVVSNLPDASAHYVDVYVYTLEEGGYKHLVACKQSTGQVFTCKCSAGTWTAWQELALNSDIGKYNVETNLTCLNDDYTAIKDLINSMPVGRQIPVKVLADTGTYFMGFVFKNEAGYGDAVLFHHYNAPRVIRLANNVLSVKHLSTTEDLTTQYIIDSVDIDYSIAGNSVGNYNLYSAVNTKPGYSPFGVVGFSTNHRDIVPLNITVASSSGYGLYLKNVSSSSVSTNFTAIILYKKN